MWRAEIEYVPTPGRVYLSIPSLFGSKVIGPVQCPIEVSPGERVVVADLTPEHRMRDWWVVGKENQLGQWGSPYPHTHAIGEVTGLNNALAGKLEFDDVQTMLAGKADTPDGWATLGLIPAFAGHGGWPGVQYRTTHYGLQLRGRVKLSGANLPLDTVIATVPGLTLPGELNVQVSCMGPAPDYTAVNFQLAIRPDGVLRTRQEWLGDGGVYSFAHTIPV